MLTVLNEIENWKSGWRLEFFNHSPKMSKVFYRITPTVCVIMPTTQNMPMEPCQLTSEYAGPMPFAAAFSSMCPHGSTAAKNVLALLGINTDSDHDIYHDPP